MNSDTEGIILAAGLSSRIPTFKMELRLYEKPILQHTIESMFNFCSTIIVVTGYKSERINLLTEKYAKVKRVFNPQYKKGMFTSVKTGVLQVKSEWFFLTPGDYPLLAPLVYRELQKARGEFNNPIFIPTYQGKRGHPVLIKSQLIKKLIQEPDDSNLRDFISQEDYLTVDVKDKSILLDVDTIEDYQRMGGVHTLERHRK